jgi:hypothetical protein
MTEATMDPIRERILQMTRRHFFRSGALGLGVPALSSLLGPGRAHATGGVPSLPHHRPRAKRAIWLFMADAPSQMDTFDYKPKMDEYYDKDLPESVRKGQRLTTMTSGQARFPIAPSIYKFKQYGQSGAWACELLSKIGSMADDLTFIKTMNTEAINHDPAITYICTGNQIPGKASLGAWLSYGLGSDNQDLPGFVVMTPTWSGTGGTQALFSRLWGAGFLPSKYQGVALRREGDPVLFLSNPAGVDAAARRRMLDALAELNQREFADEGDPETAARTAQYEMAFRMQRSVPELADLSKEPEHVLDLYGPDARKPGTFAHATLLARRMVERGVRFVQIFHRGWDHHGNLTGDLPRQCKDIDQPCWGLIQDLKQRGLLEETLVVWGGEFGRTVYCQGPLSKTNYGRDHHPRCWTMWLAGGGIKGGVVHGETDDFSYNAVRDPVHIRDLNATVLWCLGIDHARFTYKFQGLDQRLTGVEEEARVVTPILA